MGSQREVVADPLWLLNCGDKSLGRQSGSDDDKLDSDVPFWEFRPMARVPCRLFQVPDLVGLSSTRVQALA